MRQRFLACQQVYPLRKPKIGSMQSKVSMLQIGMTASRLGRSGTDRYFLALTRALEDQGCIVRGVVIGDPLEAGAIAGIESFAPNGAGRLRRWIGLRRAVKRLRGDATLVASHCAAHAFPVLDLLGDRPLIAHFHGPWAIEARTGGLGPLTINARRVEEFATYRRAKHFITVSHAFRRILESQYGVDPARIEVIPCGVDITQFRIEGSREDARRALGWPLDRRIVLIAARLVTGKGIDVLIDAIGEVRRRHTDVLLQIVGTGPLDVELRARVRERELERWVNFAGFFDDEMALAYRAADFSVVASSGLEGFPLTVPESLACGTPVLVTPRGGLPEAVAALDPGLIFAGCSVADIASGINAALDGTSRLPGAQACSDYAQRFDWTVIAQAVRTVYDEALKR